LHFQKKIGFNKRYDDFPLEKEDVKCPFDLRIKITVKKNKKQRHEKNNKTNLY